ncbi:hypothetical protein [Pseudoalteromonas sp.]|uniref:hypothetical protein n=1 Tax=Pseudoalteromonas sp. TaxID=53249 RepID=UPI003568546B
MFSRSISNIFIVSTILAFLSFPALSTKSGSFNDTYDAFAINGLTVSKGKITSEYSNDFNIDAGKELYFSLPFAHELWLGVRNNEPQNLLLSYSYAPGIWQNISLDKHAKLINQFDKSLVVKISNTGTQTATVSSLLAKPKTLRPFLPLYWQIHHPTTVLSANNQTTEYGIAKNNMPFEFDDWVVSQFAQPKSDIEDESQSVVFRSKDTLIRLSKTQFSSASWKSDVDLPYIVSRPILMGNPSKSISPATYSVFNNSSLVRQARLKNDWFFNSNFAKYAEPALQKLRDDFLRANRLGIAANTHISSVENVNKPPLRTSYKVPAIESDIPLVRHALQATHIRWATHLWEHEVPKLQMDDNVLIKLKNTFKRQVFFKSSAQQKVDVTIGKDAISNQIKFEFIVPSSVQAHGQESAIVELWANNKRLYKLNLTSIESQLTEMNWRVDKQKTHHLVSTIQLPLPARQKTFQLRFAQQTHFKVHYQVASDAKLNSIDIKTLLNEPNNRLHLQQYTNYLKYRQYLSESWQTSLPKHIWHPVITGESQQLPINTDFIKLTNETDTFKEYELIFSLLTTIKSDEEQYWLSLVTELQKLGMEHYAVNILKALTLYHPNRNIIEFATKQLVHRFVENNQHPLLLQLLAFTASKNIQTDFLLARTFLKNRQHLYSLFALFDESRISQDSAEQFIASKKNSVYDELFSLIANTLILPEERKSSLSSTTSNTSLVQKNTVPVFSSIAFTQLLPITNVSRQLDYLAYFLPAKGKIEITSSTSTMLTLSIRLLAKDRTINDDWLTVRINKMRYQIPFNKTNYINPNLISKQGRFSLNMHIKLKVVKGDVIEIESNNDSYAVEVIEQVQESWVETAQCLPPSLALSKYDNKTLNCIYKHERALEQINQRLTVVETEYHDVLTELWQIQYDYETSRSLLSLNHLVKKLNSALVLSGKSEETSFINALSKIQSRIERFTEWQIVKNPIQTSGIYNFNTNAPYIDVNTPKKNLFFTHYKNTSDDLHIGQILTYNIENSIEGQYRIKLNHLQSLFSNTSEAAVTILSNNKLITKTNISADTSIYVNLPKFNGIQEINLSVHNNTNNPIGKVQSQLQKLIQGNWVDVNIASNRRLYQSTEHTPIQFFFAEPNWIRIDSYSRNGIHSSDIRYVTKGFFSWFNSNPHFLGHRVYRLLPSLTHNNATLVSDKTSSQYLSSLSKPEKYTLFPKNTEFNGTINALPEFTPYTYGGKYQWSQAKDDDELFTQTETSNNLSLYYTQKQESGLYYQIQGGVKTFTGRLYPNFYAGFRTYKKLSELNWLSEPGWYTKIQLGAQKSYVDHSRVTYLKASSQFEWQHDWFERYINKFRLNAWYRNHSEVSDYTPFSSSVISEYKDNHKNGIQISDTLRWKLKNDFEVFSTLQINSNPIGESKWIDNAHMDLGMRLFYHQVEFQSEIEYRVFKQDINRTSEYDTMRFKSHLLWHTWLGNKRLAFGLSYQYDNFQKENFIGLSISFSNTQGRGLRDYLPDQHRFRAIKHQAYMLNRGAHFD